MLGVRPAACLGLVLACGALRAQGTAEGPLDNDTQVRDEPAVLATLRRGDAALAKLAGRPIDAQSLVPVLDLWHLALTTSAPGDLVAAEVRADAAGPATSAPRVWHTVEFAVESRLAAAGPLAERAFRERFEALAQAELDGAGFDAIELARVEHENPLTLGGALAALRSCDLAFEAGDAARAQSALDRAGARAAKLRDAKLSAAIDARRAALPRTPEVAPDAGALDTRTRCRLVATLDTGARELGRHLRPALAFDAGGGCWIQCGESLVHLDREQRVETLAPRALALDAGMDWEPAFGEEAYDWLQRPACQAQTVCLVAGRAKGDHGNALVALRAGALAWIFADAGYAGPDGERAAVSEVLLPGILEFQPGPACADGRLLVLVRQWGAVGQRVIDEGHTTVWLAALDPDSGRPLWKRELCTGADLRARTRERVFAPRLVSWPCEPLAVLGRRVLAPTALGVAALLDVGDGRPVWCFKYRRAPDAAGRAWTPEALAFQPPDPALGSGFLFAPLDTDRLVYRLGNDPADPRIGPPARIEGLVGLGAARACGAVGLAQSGDRIAPFAADLCTGARDEGLPLGRSQDPKALLVLGRRILCAGGRSLFAYDSSLRRLDDVDCPGLEREAACTLSASGRRIYLVGLAHAWIFELE